jgi:hypothetical protein
VDDVGPDAGKFEPRSASEEFAASQVMQTMRSDERLRHVVLGFDQQLVRDRLIQAILERQRAEGHFLAFGERPDVPMDHQSRQHLDELAELPA